MTSTVGIFEAKNQFSHLVALAEDGQETIITRHGHPVARIVPPAAKPVRRLGAWRGYVIPEGWDEFTDEDYQLWYEAPITADPIDGMA